MSEKLPDKLTLEFRENLQKILEERRDTLSLKGLSLKAGMGETAVRDILTGRSSSPKLETVFKISEALDIGAYDLIPSFSAQASEEIRSLRAENKALRETIDNAYASMTDELNAAKARSDKYKK